MESTEHRVTEPGGARQPNQSGVSEQRGERPPRRRAAIWLPGIALCLAAAGLRILVAAQRDGIDVDGITYLRNAQALWTGGSNLDVLHPPLYSILLAPVVGVSADPEWAARLVSAVLGALWVWPTLWLARETTDENVSWSAGLLVACFPAAVEAGTRVLSEAAYGLCLVAFLAALAAMLNRPGVALAAPAGVLGGMATLARPEGMGYLLLACGVLLAAPWKLPRGWTARRAALAVLALAIAWIATLAPYAVLVRQQTGRWHWSGKFGITLAWGESVGQEQPALVIERFLAGLQHADAPNSLVAYAADRPWAMAKRLAFGIHDMDRNVVPALLQTGGIVLLALGLLRLRWRGRTGPPEWFLPLALLPSAGVLLFLASPRYFAPLLPVMAIIAGIGLARLGSSGERVPAGRRVRAAHVLLGLVLLSFVPWVVRPWFRHDSAGVEKSAALWLRDATGPGTVFVGRHPRVAFYAQAREVPLAERPLEALLVEGRRAGARFLIVDNIHLPGLRPDLLPLMGGDPGRYSRDLALAHIAEDPSGNRVVLYRIQPSGIAGGTGGSS
jgi:4-amino-4-deoxy-L-arabinose transferase-like glycosyltransferase